MSGKLALLAAGALMAMAPAAGAESVNTRVEVESGAVQGALADNVVLFKGIPYAAAPVGALRWRAPQPAARWSGMRDATKYGADCMQGPFPLDAAPIRTKPSEDCLFLNVWRPAQVGSAKLPVMVWIHGGGFVNGGSSPAVYSGEAFARRGVILVSFNYRLGRFGFFGFPALTAEHPDEPKGDYGFLDQIAALKWVKRNIAAFGGDPDKVTVFGESAGGMSINALITSPMGRGLFKRAIIQSGGGRELALGRRLLSRDLPGSPSAESIGLNFARAHDVQGSGPEALAKLRALPAESVTSGLNMMTVLLGDRTTFSGPVEDGRIVVEAPGVAYRAGPAARVPVMVGANDADLSLSFAPSIDAALAPFGARAPEARAAYDPEGKGDLHQINLHLGADVLMTEPARFVASAVSASGAPAFEYRFAYVPQSMKGEQRTGAPHASEIPFVFDTVAARYGAALTPLDAEVARRTNAYWVNFAETGDPNGAGLARWPRYRANSDRLLEIGPDGSFVGGPDSWKARLDLVQGLAAAPTDPRH